MIRLARLLVTFNTPILLVLANTLIVMTPLWLAAAYNRPGFPPDSYGFSRSERIELATRVTSWLGSNEGLIVLHELRLPDGREMFNARELRHLQDVKLLAGQAYRLAILALALFATGLVICLRNGALHAALQRGAQLTLFLLFAIVVYSVASWNQAFTDFHRLFFASGTWYFAYSDTLIRLFPEQFWFDALLFLAGLTAAQAFALILLTNPSPPGWKTLRPLLYWRRRESGASNFEQAKRP
ncbi:MAG: TIGR01906 family membrane protein [Anaerolineaceae bacterium]|nr:TIGR01906 family membrane protein [Anaerolineaceae bacterium]